MDQTMLHLDPVHRLPRYAFWQFQEANASLHLAEIAEARRYDEALSHLRDDYLHELHKIVGERHLDRYIALHQKRIAAMRAAREKHPPTVEGYAEFQKVQKRIVQRSTTLIQQSGVDVSRVKTLQAEYRRKASALFLETVGAGEKQPGRPIVRRSNNQTYHPPYLGWSTDILPGSSADTSLSFAHTRADRITGAIQSDSTLSLVDADDSDYVYVLCRPRFRIVYTMREAGEVTVTVDLECTQAYHSGRIDNECGYSEIDLTQRLRVYAQRTWPRASSRIYAELPGVPDYHDTHASSHRWSGTLLASEAVRELTLTLPGTMEADEMMGIDVGIETYNQVWSNDCTVDSQLIHDYTMTEVHLTAA